MGKHTRCVIGVCDNDKRYPNKMIKHSNVIGDTIVFHKLPKDPKIRADWVNQIVKGREDLSSEKDLPKECYVCSIHFIDGKPTKENPTPTLFLTVSTNTLPTPKKRKKPMKRTRLEPQTKKTTLHEQFDSGDYDTDIDQPATCDVGVLTDMPQEPIPVQFSHITRECDVVTFTGLEGPEMFKALFDYVKIKAQAMTYWDGQKKTLRLKKRASSADLHQALLSSPDYDIDPILLPIRKSGPSRKLSLEQEFLLVLMKLRLNLLNDDLAFRFQISSGKVSQTFITWIKLLSKELSVLIIWPSRVQVRATLPESFRKLFPKTRTIN